MTNRILVPLDGSPAAEVGLQSACRLARDSGAAIHLVRTTMFFAGDRSTYDEERRALHEAKDYLEEREQALRQEDFSVQSDVLPCDPVRGILFAAESRGAGLISMSTHGRGGVGHALLGSVAEAVLRKSDTPILFTRVTKHEPESTGNTFRKLLIALDGSRFAETSLEAIEAQDIASNAEVDLVRVVIQHAPLAMPGLVSEVASQLGEDMDRETARAVKEAEAYLHKIGHSHLFGRGWRAIVAVGSPCSEILEAARSNGADIIAVSTHGRHGLDKVLYGSVALDLLRHVEVPLLIVHGRVAAMEPINLISAQTLEQRRRTFFMQSDT